MNADVVSESSTSVIHSFNAVVVAMQNADENWAITRTLKIMIWFIFLFSVRLFFSLVLPWWWSWDHENEERKQTKMRNSTKSFSRFWIRIRANSIPFNFYFSLYRWASRARYELNFRHNNFVKNWKLYLICKFNCRDYDRNDKLFISSHVHIISSYHSRMQMLNRQLTKLIF